MQSVIVRGWVGGCVGVGQGPVEDGGGGVGGGWKEPG